LQKRDKKETRTKQRIERLPLHCTQFKISDWNRAGRACVRIHRKWLWK